MAHGARATNASCGASGDAAARTTREAGWTLIETLATIALAALAAGALLGGLRGIAANVSMQRAAATVADAFVTARSFAYLRSEHTLARIDETGVRVEAPRDDALRFDLPPGLRIARASRGGVVRFFADGLSDNASVRIEHADGGREREIFVDGRGEIR